VAEDAIDGSVERVSALITARGGQVNETNIWGRRRLAYPINRHLEGTYVQANISLAPTAVSELENALRINEDVIRHMVIRPQ
jgi:small subunit ribosomal protein S6